MNRREALKSLGACVTGTATGLPRVVLGEECPTLEGMQLLISDVIKSLTREDEGNKGYDLHERCPFEVKEVYSPTEVEIRYETFDKYFREFDFGEKGWIKIKYFFWTNEECKKLYPTLKIERADKNLSGEKPKYFGWCIFDHNSNGLKKGEVDSMENLECEDVQKCIDTKLPLEKSLHGYTQAKIEGLNKDYMKTLEEVFMLMQTSGRGKEKIKAGKINCKETS